MGNEDPAVLGSNSHVKNCHAREVELLKEPSNDSSYKVKLTPAGEIRFVNNYMEPACRTSTFVTCNII